MTIICPAILAENPHAYREQMSNVAPFASRVQIDLTDGEFAPGVKTVDVANVYWAETIEADIHLMFKNPATQIETLINLKPRMVIMHAEADGDLLAIIRQLHSQNIKAGVALLPATNPEDKKELIQESDHVLIFSGDLGHFGGKADLGLLKKVRQIKGINADAEIGWDGGVNTGNVSELATGGIDVLNVGGAIQRMPDPKFAYDELVKAMPKEAREEI